MRSRKPIAITLVAAGLCLLTALPAGAAGGKKCDKEMRDDHATFLTELRRQNFYSQTGTNKAAEAELVKWLEDAHAYVVKHEKAHARAAGKWSGKIQYLYYTWRGKKYATSGCVSVKGRIPLTVDLKSKLAPQNPSDWDLEIAEKIKKEIKIKKSRERCRKMKGHAKQQKCLKKYQGYRWLDNYPLK